MSSLKFKAYPQYFQFSTARSSGPGGQGVNTTESKVELRFHVASAPWLSEEQKNRWRVLFAGKINNDDQCVVSSQKHRSQKQNLQECLNLIEDMYQQAAYKPKPRKPSKPTKSAIRKRLDSKKKHQNLKKTRTKVQE